MTDQFRIDERYAPDGVTSFIVKADGAVENAGEAGRMIVQSEAAWLAKMVKHQPGTYQFKDAPPPPAAPLVPKVPVLDIAAIYAARKPKP